MSLVFHITAKTDINRSCRKIYTSLIFQQLLMFMCFKLFAGIRVAGTWSVQFQTHVAVNQATLDLTA